MAHSNIALHLKTMTTLKRKNSLFLFYHWRYCTIGLVLGKFTRGRSPTSEDSGAWRIGAQNGLW